MVSHTGTQARPRGADAVKSAPRPTIKPLNAPRPIQVRTTGYGSPAAVCVETARDIDRSRARRRTRRVEETWLAVSQVDDIWKINDEWWRGPDEEIERLYFSLTLENGQHVTVFHDLARRTWRRQAD